MARATAHIADDPPYGALLYDFSTVELLSFVEVYAVSCYAVYLLFSHAAMQTATHRRQAALVGGGILLSLFASVPGLLGYRWFGQRDSSPLWFAVSGLCVTWALGRYRLFDLVPIARDAVIENLSDAIFVLDSQNRLLDANPAARALLGASAAFDIRHAQSAPDWLMVTRDRPHEDAARRELNVPGRKAIYELSEAPYAVTTASRAGAR